MASVQDPAGRARAGGSSNRMTGRRAFLAGAAGLLAAPLATEAQPPPKVYRVGLLGGFSPTSPESSHVWEGFFQGLRERGYVVGQDLVTEGRFYEDRLDRLPALAAELVGSRST